MGSVDQGHFHRDRSVCSVSMPNLLLLPHQSLFPLHPTIFTSPTALILSHFQNPILGLRPRSSLAPNKGQRHDLDGILQQGGEKGAGDRPMFKGGLPAMTQRYRVTTVATYQKLGDCSEDDLALLNQESRGKPRQLVTQGPAFQPLCFSSHTTLCWTNPNQLKDNVANFRYLPHVPFWTTPLIKVWGRGRGAINFQSPPTCLPRFLPLWGGGAEVVFIAVSASWNVH